MTAEQTVKPQLRAQLCDRRAWHRVREYENAPSELHAAVCVDCGQTGPISWAAVHLLREQANENCNPEKQ